MIEVRDLHKSFGPKQVLKGVSFNIPAGKTFCIIGKSGCGKSVLLKNMVGLLEPDRGTVIVDGQEVKTLGQEQMFGMRRNMGFVFQGAALFDSLNVYENIIISLYEHGQRDELLLRDEAQRVLSSVGLLPPLSDRESNEFQKEWQILKEKMPSDLSGGMRKRVGVARALVGSPKYIFYDEPTTGLDPVTSEQVDDMVADLANKLNVTSIVITHDMFSVFRIAEHVVMLDRGEIRFQGSAEELKLCTDNVVRDFIERFM